MIEKEFLAFLEGERKRVRAIGTIQDQLAVERIYLRYLADFGKRINPVTMQDYVDMILADEGVDKASLNKVFGRMKYKRAKIIKRIQDECPGFFGQVAIGEALGLSKTVISQALDCDI